MTMFPTQVGTKVHGHVFTEHIKGEDKWARQ